MERKRRVGGKERGSDQGGGEPLSRSSLGGRTQAYSSVLVTLESDLLTRPDG